MLTPARPVHLDITGNDNDNDNDKGELVQSLPTEALVPLPLAPSIVVAAEEHDTDGRPGRQNVLKAGPLRTAASPAAVSTPSSSVEISRYAGYTRTTITTFQRTTAAEGKTAHCDEATELPAKLTKDNVSLLMHQASGSLSARLPPKSFSQHRKFARSAEIPRASILKALAARNPTSPVSLAHGIRETTTVADDNNNVTTMTSTGTMPLGNILVDTAKGPLAQLQHDALSESLETPRASTGIALQSPCFYHQRFDQVVDFEKVLDEIALDQNMSHSRLLQTATGVREVSRQLQRRPIKAAVRNVMIVTKARDNSLVSLTREVAEWLIRTPRYGGKYGVNVYVDRKLKHSKRFNAPALINDEPEVAEMLKYWTPDLCWTSPDKFDLVITLGGDGTVLFTSWLFQRIVPPILSFSLGSLGFLTNFQFDLYKQHLDKILSEGMRVNLRMRFTCTVYRAQPTGEPIEAERFEVLNELVIDRGPSPYVSSMELYGDDSLITVIQADGCIFSTPTGSTAYSLSAGGSLVHPDIPATLVTPICPHTLSFRPMILSDSMLLKVSIPKTSRATAFCAFDGRARLELKQGDYITLAASQYPFPTVLSQPQEWIDSIVRTLRWNTRAAAQKAFSKDEDGEHDIDGENQGWDIDTTDSGCYSDDENGSTTSPLRRQMSLLMQ